jgi:hypothetical protein
MRVGELLVRGEMEVREDELVLPHVRPFDLDRLLHLHDHLAVLPHRRRIRRDLRAHFDVVVIGEAAAETTAGLDEHRMSSANQHLCARRHECDAILVCLDLFWNADFHWPSISMSVVIPHERQASVGIYCIC